LLLIHQVPPKPDYLRVKVRRRLQRLGAVPLKSSVYVLPDTDENLEDFQWLANEIVADGGDATICSASMLSGVSDADLAGSFPALRGEPPITSAERIDVPRGAVWVTRQNVFIDRMASAWLIRRFIDPDATFKFVSRAPYRRKPNELRFDMFEAEFTHVGERCTFEVLLAHFRLDDPALRAIGEIVHDIDLKDEKFRREETAGVLAVIQGVTLAPGGDAERIERGTLVLDGVYAQLQRRR
jgi:hypothetical protein